MNYRPEIDGLRALAVLPVVLFHAGIPAFDGGFVGVDIFFVISGYLITGIIAAELRAGRFSLKTFYERRARRILPALFLVAAVTLPFAWLWMMPSQLKDYAQTLVAVAAFSANLYFYFKSGYFEPSLELNPLLHTWSLAVEEQYYVIFPALMALLSRWNGGAIRVVLGLLMVSSFGLAEWMSSTAPSANYYFATSRIWELLIGALIALAGPRREGEDSWASLASAIGAGCLVASLFVIDSTTPYPGVWALLPVGGSALIVAYASKHDPIGRALSSRWLVGLGLISYSTYLWHQPLFAFARLRSLDEPRTSQMAFLALASLGLGYASWRWVETPFRDRTRFGRRSIAIFSICGLGLLVVLGVAGHRTEGFAKIKYALAGPDSEKYQKRLEAASKTRERWAGLLERAADPFDPSVEGRVLVLGDSLSEDLYVSLVLNQDRLAGYQFRRLLLDDLCMGDLKDAGATGRGECASQARTVADHPLLKQADLILVTAGWDARSPALVRDLLEHLEDRPIIVFGTAAFAEIGSLLYHVTTRDLPIADWPAFFARHKHLPSRDASREIAEVAALHGVRFIDKYEFFCHAVEGEQGCRLVGEDGHPILVDQSHVSLDGAAEMGRFASERRWLAPAP